MFYLIFIYITLLKLHGNELCLALLQRSTCINSFSLSQFQSSQVQSTLGLLRRWRGRMIGCYRQQRKAAVGTTTTTTSRPAVLLSVCLCLSSLNDSWLWRYGSAGYMRAVTYSSQHLRQLLQLLLLCFGAVEETTTGWFGFVFVEQREACRRAAIRHFNIGVLRPNTFCVLTYYIFKNVKFPF